MTAKRQYNPAPANLGIHYLGGQVCACWCGVLSFMKKAVKSHGRTVSAAPKKRAGLLRVQLLNDDLAPDYRQGDILACKFKLVPDEGEPCVVLNENGNLYAGWFKPIKEGKEDSMDVFLLVNSRSETEMAWSSVPAIFAVEYASCLATSRPMRKGGAK